MIFVIINTILLQLLRFTLMQVQNTALRDYVYIYIKGCFDVL